MRLQATFYKLKEEENQRKHAFMIKKNGFH